MWIHVISRHITYLSVCRIKCSCLIHNLLILIVLIHQHSFPPKTGNHPRQFARVVRLHRRETTARHVGTNPAERNSGPSPGFIWFYMHTYIGLHGFYVDLYRIGLMVVVRPQMSIVSLWKPSPFSAPEHSRWYTLPSAALRTPPNSATRLQGCQCQRRDLVLTPSEHLEDQNQRIIYNTSIQAYQSTIELYVGPFELVCCTIVSQ